MEGAQRLPRLQTELGVCETYIRELWNSSNPECSNKKHTNYPLFPKKVGRFVYGFSPHFGRNFSRRPLMARGSACPPPDIFATKGRRIPIAPQAKATPPNPELSCPAARPMGSRQDTLGGL